MDFRKFVVDEAVGAARVGGALEKVRGFDEISCVVCGETYSFGCQCPIWLAVPVLDGQQRGDEDAERRKTQRGQSRSEFNL